MPDIFNLHWSYYLVKKKLRRKYMRNINKHSNMHNMQKLV